MIFNLPVNITENSEHQIFGPASVLSDLTSDCGDISVSNTSLILFATSSDCATGSECTIASNGTAIWNVSQTDCSDNGVDLYAFPDRVHAINVTVGDHVEVLLTTRYIIVTQASFIAHTVCAYSYLSFFY
jgi:hypothetical protein